MPRVEERAEKIDCIRTYLKPLVGQRFLKYETAELLHEDGTWTVWNDLPIRLFAESAEPVSLAWSHFDRLWLETGLALPFSIEGMTVRWAENSIPSINPFIGAEVNGVKLGRGDASINGCPLEIWTRLLLVFEAGCLEVYNALDENGYAVHSHIPPGEFIKCV
jgi:hypothetical protein